MRFIYYLCIMNNKAKTPKSVVSPSEADIFSKKVPHYLVCFINSCPLHEQCLRWLVGRHAPQEPLSHVAVNPLNPNVGVDNCELYRPNVRVIMKRGLTHFYYDMPGHTEKAIRSALIGHFGHKYYFEMRKGERLITPDQQQTIERVCRHYGWNGPLNYDGEQEDWDW